MRHAPQAIVAGGKLARVHLAEHVGRAGHALLYLASGQVVTIGGVGAGGIVANGAQVAGGIVAVDDVAPAAGLADLAAKRVITEIGAPATLVDAGHQPAIAAIHVLLALASGIGLAH